MSRQQNDHHNDHEERRKTHKNRLHSAAPRSASQALEASSEQGLELNWRHTRQNCVPFTLEVGKHRSEFASIQRNDIGAPKIFTKRCRKPYHAPHPAMPSVKCQANVSRSKSSILVPSLSPSKGQVHISSTAKGISNSHAYTIPSARRWSNLLCYWPYWPLYSLVQMPLHLHYPREEARQLCSTQAPRKKVKSQTH